MIITSNKITKRLQDIWPLLQQIWCFDQEYLCPSLKDIETFVGQYNIHIDDIKAEHPDCDDFALQLHAKVKLHYNWAFGEAFGNKFSGWSVLHSLNIAICQEGVYLIDAKPGTIRLVDKNVDNVLWVRI